MSLLSNEKPLDAMPDVTKESKTQKLSNRMWILDVCTSILIISACVGLLVWFGLHNHVFHHSVNKIVLLVAGISSLTFIGIGLYLTYVVEAKYGSNYDKSHELHIQIAATALCSGFISFIVSYWPVYRFWTILLSFTLLTLMIRIITLVPTSVTVIRKIGN